MTDHIQSLLNKEADLSNQGHGQSPFRKIIWAEIKLLRGTAAPDCWGEDDCSTQQLSTCPWRIDCADADSSAT